MKSTLRFFAFLDILSFLLLSEQVFKILANLQDLSLQSPSGLRMAVLLLMYPLLLISAYALYRIRKLGLLVYYFQFPLRLFVWVFSFGFLTLISQYFNNPEIFNWLFRAAVVLEFFRLYFTFQIHRQHFRGLRRPN
ncbi:MAG TPA: hypothetical protein VLZ28_06785 [Daejeonella sp.]|nr:hypothetical protein [Daejeonella sp.]